MSDDITLDFDTLRQHAALVSSVADEVGKAISSVKGGNLGSEVFGIMCAFLVPPSMAMSLAATGMLPAPFMFGPFGVMRRLFDDLAQLAGVGGPPVSELEQLPGMFVPQIDVQQRDDRIVVHADLPGTAPADVQLRIEDNALIVEGERRTEHEREQGGIVRTERVYGRFQRMIPLPEGADPESAEARFANGVLEVTIKTPQRRKGRQIEIQSGGEQAGQQQGAKDTAKH